MKDNSLYVSPDIDLGMGFLDKLNPFSKPLESITGTLDTWVEESTLDKDKALELKTLVRQLELEIESNQLEFDKAKFELREKSYQLELKTKTGKFTDSFHKLSRTLQGFYQQTLAFLVLVLSDVLNIPIDGNTLGILGIGVMTSGVYAWKKGKGAPVKQ